MLEATLWSWALLISGLVCALFTWNAWRPLYRPPRAALVSFAAGWLTAELALHHLIWQLVLGGVLIALGALDEAPGWVGFALFIISWAGLVRLHQRGQLAKEAAARALDSWVDDESLRRPLSLRTVARPFAVQHSEVICERDLKIAEVDSIAIHADIRYRRDRPQNAPICVFIHGGAWTIGYREYQALPLLNRLAAAGWVCISAGYRLSPKATFPDHIQDVNRALSWVQSNAERYGGDPNFVVIAGNSAGGHLASLAALSWDVEEFVGSKEIKTQPLAACVSFYGIYDLIDRHQQWPHHGLKWLLQKRVFKKAIAENLELYKQASPIDHVRRDAPPFMVVHGLNDTLVPIDEARHFVEALKSVSQQPVVYLEVPDAQHAFEVFRSVRSHYTLRAVAKFLEILHSQYKERQG